MPVYQKDYFGFVYIWLDRKRKMFYIGSHMGDKDDGYVCSSKVMREAYRRRQKDFRRKIIYWHSNNDKRRLLEIEQKWLMLIPKGQLGSRYYNLSRGGNGGWGEIMKEHWKDENYRTKTITSQTTAQNQPEQKQKLSEASKQSWQDPSYRETIVQSLKDRKGEKRSEEAKESYSKSVKGLWTDPEYRTRMSQAAKNRKSPSGVLRQVVVRGVTYPSVAEACRQLGLPYKTIRWRLSKDGGWSVEEAFNS